MDTFITPGLSRFLSLALNGALALICAGAMAVHAAPATKTDPAHDFLERPSLPTHHGAKRRLVGVSAIGQRLLAVGDMGLIIESDDRGKSWQQIPSPVSVMLTAVSASDDKTLWAVGHDGVILQSQDSGKTWLRRFDGWAGNQQMLAAAQRQVDLAAKATGTKEQIAGLQEGADNRLADAEAANESGPYLPLFGIQFVDPNTGFAVGAFGQLFQTVDAGKTWNYIGDRLDNPTGFHLNAISVDRSGTVRIAAEGGALFQSSDRGAHWERINLPYKGQMFGVIAPVADQPKALLAYGFGGHLFASDAEGKNWHELASPVHKTFVGAVKTPANAVLLVTQQGQFVMTSDQGKSLQLLAMKTPLDRVSAMSEGLEPGTVVLVGQRGVSVSHINPSPAVRP